MGAQGLLFYVLENYYIFKLRISNNVKSKQITIYSDNVYL